MEGGRTSWQEVWEEFQRDMASSCFCFSEMNGTDFVSPQFPHEFFTPCKPSYFRPLSSQGCLGAPGVGGCKGSGGDGQHQHGGALTLTALACCTVGSEEHWDGGGLESQPKNVKRKREADKELEIRSQVKYLPPRSAGKGQDRRQSLERSWRCRC